MVKQQGAGLLEVMIGLFVLAIGLLGVASLQNKALQQNNTAFLYSQALFLIDDVTERMRANRDEVASYATEFSEKPTTSKDCISNVCTEDDMAEWDLANWKSQVAAVLPQGRARIEVAASTVIVSVEFDDSRGEDDPIDVIVSTEI
jgi:type IV pilus assembly protein PilV